MLLVHVWDGGKLGHVNSSSTDIVTCGNIGLWGDRAF
jgi:hypothetical protein